MSLCPNKVRWLKYMMCKEKLKEMCLFNVMKKRLKGDLTIYSYLIW